MKKIYTTGFLFLFVLFGYAMNISAQELQPTLRVSLSGSNPPTQRVYVGSEGVEVFRVWLTPHHHEQGSITLKTFRIEHEGDKSHFLRYNLVQDNRVLSTVSLPSGNFIEFRNLNIVLSDDMTTELRVFADVSQRTIEGDHVFFIGHPNDVPLEKNDIRDLETKVIGNFPVESNRIVIGESFETPSAECNMREEPVCGVDGKTYYNMCIPFQKNIALDYMGVCYESDNRKQTQCGSLVEPICGSDGRTYANTCFLEQKEGIFKRYDGECFPQDFEFPRLFSQAVELLSRKSKELQQVRPRLSDTAQNRLQDVVSVLQSYNFTSENTEDLLQRIGEFLEFSTISSKGLMLEQEIEKLNAAVIQARARSAQKKYESGIIPFRDVDENAWFLSSVNFMKNNNFIQDLVSIDDMIYGTFRPEEFVTKAEATHLLLLVQGKDMFEVLPPRNRLGRSHRFHNAISVAETMNASLWARDANPDQKINRFEMIQLITELYDLEVPDYPRTVFRDVENQEFVSVLEFARDKGLIAGYADGSVRPKRLLTRAEAVHLIWKAHSLFGDL